MSLTLNAIAAIRTKHLLAEGNIVQTGKCGFYTYYKENLMYTKLVRKFFFI